MFIDQVNILLSILAVLGQAFVICAAAYLFFYRKRNNKLVDFMTRNAIPLAFLAALTAVGGSLYYSEIAHFQPCDLCWFQRIFMYPQVILLGLAWGKKENRIIDYSLAILGIGILISLYHNYIYYTAQPTNFCSIISPCTQQYIVGFGYITIPLMALTGFAVIGLLLLNKRLRSGQS